MPNAFAKLIQGTGVIQITVWPTDPGGDILSEKTIINVVDGKIAVAKDCDKKTPYIQRLAVKREDGKSSCIFNAHFETFLTKVNFDSKCLQ